jgi:hypothetical protein
MSQAQLTPAEREAEPGLPLSSLSCCRHVIPRNAEAPHVIFAEVMLLESVYESVQTFRYLDVDIIVACAV